MSKRAGGGNATVTRGLCVGYMYIKIEDIKSYKPEVKASKSDKRLRSYGHSKFACIHSHFLMPTVNQLNFATALISRISRSHIN